MKRNLLFYKAYEKFYAMANKSECFRKYCAAAYGADLSQDGFSDIDQINLILEYAPKIDGCNILDIGCGNGKMLKYLQHRIGGNIYGFDYSENAINTARTDCINNADFRVGIIGEISYPANMFDLAVSMDTVYFAKNMNQFIGQIHGWLKDNGVLFIGYQEGDIMAKTTDSESTVLAQALNRYFKYDVIDYTRQTYDMLRRKRKTVTRFKDEFMREKLCKWYSLILNQTNSVTVSYEDYVKHNARYIYIARK